MADACPGKNFRNLLNESPASPFLFIGAGFSRRYINLENWADLLKHFCTGLKDFHYYLSTSGSSLAQVATLMAQDFHQSFWEDPSHEELRKRVGTRLKNKESALKFAIAEYVERKSISSTIPAQYVDEFEALGKLNVDGIITTNWDCFLEQKFPDYKVFVGQDDLLYSNAQGICEIYKIHGCARRPESLVLTSGDYQRFEDKNAYLAAKLITIFMEHPIIFIGYSLHDQNIINLLCSMAKCLGDRIELLKNNLIFVEWESGHPLSIESSCFVINSAQTIPITLIKTDSFLPVFTCLAETKHKIPAKILRYCKESIYNLVLDAANETHDNICAIGLEDVEDLRDIDFVVGLGIVSNLGKQGYSPITTRQIFHDILFNDGKFNARKLMLDTMIPFLTKGRSYLPVFKYLRKQRITDNKTFENSDYTGLSKFVENSDYKCKAYARSFVATASKCSISDILTTFDPLHTIIYLAYVKITNPDDVTLLENFLKEHFDEYFENDSPNIKQEYKKLICRYDRLKNGW